MAEDNWCLELQQAVAGTHLGDEYLLIGLWLVKPLLAAAVVAELVALFGGQIDFQFKITIFQLFHRMCVNIPLIKAAHQAQRLGITDLIGADFERALNLRFAFQWLFCDAHDLISLEWLVKNCDQIIVLCLG